VSVTSVDTDYDNLTVTLIADFDAPIPPPLPAKGPRKKALGVSSQSQAAGPPDQPP
jgi:hypothetical protein